MSSSHRLVRITQKLSLLVVLLFSMAWAPHSPLHSVLPAYDQDFPDPGVVKANDGWYYAYATQGIVSEPPGGRKKIINIQMARSRDLKNWQFLGEALPKKPSRAQNTQLFWAPDVSFHEGLYHMYFSALPDTEEGFCIGAATSQAPQGPFIDSGRPLVCGPSFTTIDPMAFDDPQTGERLLYWGSGFGAIKVQPLAPNRQQFEKDSRPIEVLRPSRKTNARDYRHLLEGAWVVQRNGYYYLFTSGDSCCEPAHYAVLVARSHSAKGPFEFQKIWTDSLLIQSDERYLAPGHNSVVENFEGRSFILYHAIDRAHPQLTDKIPNDREVRRILLVQELDWSSDWPQLKIRRQD